MVKYSFDFKLKIVKEYLEGQGGRAFLAQKYGTKADVLIIRWVKAYEKFGVQGLQRKRQNTAYSPQFKLNAVNLYLTSEKSYQELAQSLGITTPAQITRWVLDYREKGEFAFSKARGRPRKEPELSTINLKKVNDNRNETEQELAKLQNENLNLRHVKHSLIQTMINMIGILYIN